jgi:hypothetical protein
MANSFHIKQVWDMESLLVNSTKEGEHTQTCLILTIVKIDSSPVPK